MQRGVLVKPSKNSLKTYTCTRSDRDLPLLNLNRHNTSKITTIEILWMREDPSIARVGEVNLCPMVS